MTLRGTARNSRVERLSGMQELDRCVRGADIAQAVGHGSSCEVLGGHDWVGCLATVFQFKGLCRFKQEEKAIGSATKVCGRRR
jgi:hypothetical protein